MWDDIADSLGDRTRWEISNLRITSGAYLAQGKNKFFPLLKYLSATKIRFSGSRDRAPRFLTSALHEGRCVISQVLLSAGGPHQHSRILVSGPVTQPCLKVWLPLLPEETHYCYWSLLFYQGVVLRAVTYPLAQLDASAALSPGCKPAGCHLSTGSAWRFSRFIPGV
jgi:hypothetical protein